MHRTNVVQSATFKRWLAGVADIRARARVLARIDRLTDGNSGDSKALGGGVFELRIDYGPGYRVYVMRRGEALVLLCGGTKTTQRNDIEYAIAMARTWK